MKALMKRRMIWAVMVLIVVLSMSGAESVFAAENELKRDDPFAFRGGAVLQELREKAQEYPDSFDLRNVDTDNDGNPDKSFVTPVRLQNPFGTCWGFAVAAAAESSLIADGLADESIDLSEKHIAWFVTSHLEDPESSQNGEGWYFNDLTKKDLKTSAYRYDTGGIALFATSLFAAGMGPVVEDAADPETGEPIGDVLEYRGARGEKIVRRTAVAYDEEGNPTKWARKAVWNSEDDDWSIPEKYRYLQSFRLKESIILPSLRTFDEDYHLVFNEDNLNAFKQQLYEGHRAIGISFCAESYLPGQDTTGKQYMSSHWAHYVPEPEFSNHAVTIVAWDDNYPKENFLTTPPGDGAFLIKNSWGSELNDFPNNGYRHWGLLEGMDGVPYDPDAKATSDRATGYFWLSYYDASLTDPEAFVFEPATEENEYDIAQYDFLQANSIDVYERSENCKTANVFTAEKTSELKDISVMTTIPGTEVEYAVYMLPDDFDDPEDGLKIASGKETFTYGGYHRISVNTSRVLAKDQQYSVVIRETADNDSPYRIGSPDGSYASYKYYFDSPYDKPSYNMVIVNYCESYCHINGQWKDISYEAVQEEFTGADYYRMDNFPIKAYLKPVFDGYLAVDNWQDGTPGSFNVTVEGNKTMTAEFRGLSEDVPEGWDPEIKWTSSDESILKVTPKASDYGEAVLTGVAEGKAYLTVDAGKYGSRVVGIEVNKPEIYMFYYDERDKVYTGKPIKPEVTDVSADTPDGGITSDLVEGVDYLVSYKDNTDAGVEARIIVTGIGKYGGCVEYFFTILKAKNTMKASGKTVKLKAAQLKKKAKTIKAAKAYSVKNAKGKVTYKRAGGSKKLTVASNGNITVMKGTGKGTYKLKVKISAAGNKNYKPATKTVTVKVKVA